MSGKPVGLIGGILGGVGTVYAQMQIREILKTMHFPVLSFQKVLISQVHQKFDVHQKVLTDERTKRYLQSYLH